MSITSRVRHGVHLGADETLLFRVDLQPGDNLAAWDLEFVIRDRDLRCRDPREDTGRGALRMVVALGAGLTVDADESTVAVELVGADVLAAGITADDYYAALNRIDAGNVRPLAIIAPLHFSTWPRSS